MMRPIFTPKFFTAALLILSAAFWSCSENTAGVLEGGNTTAYVIKGKLLYSGGSPAINTEVQASPLNLPILLKSEALAKSYQSVSVTTDAAGEFSLSVFDYGGWLVQATDENGLSLRKEINIVPDQTEYTIDTDTLFATGDITGVLKFCGDRIPQGIVRVYGQEEQYLTEPSDGRFLIETGVGPVRLRVDPQEGENWYPFDLPVAQVRTNRTTEIGVIWISTQNEDGAPCSQVDSGD
jgi:hypothetical protein